MCIIYIIHIYIKVSSVELRATTPSQSHSLGHRKELLYLILTNMKFWGISVPWGKEDYLRIQATDWGIPGPLHAQGAVQLSKPHEARQPQTSIPGGSNSKSAVRPLTQAVWQR